MKRLFSSCKFKFSAKILYAFGAGNARGADKPEKLAGEAAQSLSERYAVALQDRQGFPLKATGVHPGHGDQKKICLYFAQGERSPLARRGTTGGFHSPYPRAWRPEENMPVLCTGETVSAGAEGDDWGIPSPGPPGMATRGEYACTSHRGNGLRWRGGLRAALCPEGEGGFRFPPSPPLDSPESP